MREQGQSDSSNTKWAHKSNKVIVSPRMNHNHTIGVGRKISENPVTQTPNNHNNV
jgi:hypothetical protein